MRVPVQHRRSLPIGEDSALRLRDAFLRPFLYFGGDTMSLIQVNDLSFSYDGSYEPVFEHVSFQIDTNWKLGFTGRNGRGKTTFLRLLLGEFPYQGTISASVPFSYFPFSVKRPESLAIEAAEEMNPTYEFWRLQREMARLRLDEAMLYRPYATLSGGEQTKLQLAVLFSSENNFLLIDEPTNHLDMRTKDILKEALRKFEGTVIVVSHDRDFLTGLADKVYEFANQHIKEYLGGITDFLAAKKIACFREYEQLHKPKGNGISNDEAEREVSENKLSFEERKQLNKEIRKAEQRVERAEQRVTELESEVAALEKQMAAGVVNDELLKKYGETQKELEEAMTEWEKATEEEEEVKSKR
mgnify:CR=1 FL=1